MADALNARLDEADPPILSCVWPRRPKCLEHFVKCKSTIPSIPSIPINFTKGLILASDLAQIPPDAGQLASTDGPKTGRMAIPKIPETCGRSSRTGIQRWSFVRRRTRNQGDTQT